ncbi:HTH_Tnp_Tc3_2 domain-containing protein [Trichonephila clavipes]|nr:HTH_Tnp_Tc3_2 domain-containing protein [Trichonephila clavipes]
MVSLETLKDLMRKQTTWYRRTAARYLKKLQNSNIQAGKSNNSSKPNVFNHSEGFKTAKVILSVVYGKLKSTARNLFSLIPRVVVVSNPLGARKPTLSPFDLSALKSHTPGLALHTTVAGKCISNPEDEQEKQGQSVISRLWQQFQDDGNVIRCYSTDLPRVTTPNEDRYLEVTAKTNRWSTASDLSRQLSSATGTTVSRQTVYRRLGHIGLYARRPLRCVPLTATHCHLQLSWSREHVL